jgi:hypothetical protein
MGLFVFYTTCQIDGWFGAVLLAIDYLSYAFLFYVSGFAIARNNAYYSFLLGYLYLLAWFAFWCLSTQFPEPQPLCSFVDPPALLATRQRGWPSLDALLLTVPCVSLIGKQLLGEGGLPFKLQFFILVLYPLWIVGDFVSRNATLNQLVASVLIGSTISAFMVVLFHFVARTYYHSLYALPVIGSLIIDPPPSELADSAHRDDSKLDHDILMLFPAHDSTNPDQKI